LLDRCQAHVADSAQGPLHGILGCRTTGSDAAQSRRVDLTYLSQVRILPTLNLSAVTDDQSGEAGIDRVRAKPSGSLSVCLPYR